MRFFTFVILMLFFTGCGNTISELNSLSSSSDVEHSAWPKLVDTPVAPDGVLLPETGVQATQRLKNRTVAVQARSARAGSVVSVTAQLDERGRANLARDTLSNRTAVDSAALLARAGEIRRRTALSGAGFANADLAARATRQQSRNSLTEQPVNHRDLITKVRDARIMSSKPATPLSVTAVTQPSRQPGPVQPIFVDPIVPEPLRALDAPVVSTSFQERARLAQERAKKAGS